MTNNVLPNDYFVAYSIWESELFDIEHAFKPEKFRWLLSIVRTKNDFDEEYLRKLDVIAGYIYAMCDTITEAQVNNSLRTLKGVIQDIRGMARRDYEG